MRIKLTIIFIFISVSVGIYSQDVHFSQIEYSPLTLNPALAGSAHDLSANVIYKTQWSAVATPYQTFAASVNSILNTKYKPKKKAYIAGGLEFYNDWSGDTKFNTSNIRLHLATHIVLAKQHMLGLGAYGGWASRNFDINRVQWGSQYDGMEYDSSLPSGEYFAPSIGASSRGALDVGAGMVYTFNSERSKIGENDSRRVSVGIAAYHVNQPKYFFLANSDERLFMRFSGFVTTSFGIDRTKLFLEPSVYYQHQGSASELLIGTYVKYLFKENSSITNFFDEISGSLGIFYRNRDALIFKAYFDWKGLGVGFAYDFNLFNSLSTISKSRGGIEGAIRYVILDYDRRGYLSGGKMVL